MTAKKKYKNALCNFGVVLQTTRSRRKNQNKSGHVVCVACCFVTCLVIGNFLDRI